ncbi:hypothetical protein BHM03_00026618 [Ensete ventricosum]|nr:hypothetical protein BHM03_00026618 [Ensete ventricosum]
MPLPIRISYSAVQLKRQNRIEVKSTEHPRRYTLSGDKLFYIVRQYLMLRATSYFNSASAPNVTRQLLRVRCSGASRATRAATLFWLVIGTDARQGLHLYGKRGAKQLTELRG